VESSVQEERPCGGSKPQPRGQICDSDSFLVETRTPAGMLQIKARGRVCSPSPDSATAIRPALRLPCHAAVAGSGIMVSNKDSASKRLRREIKRVRNPLRIALRRPPDVDWTDRRLREAAANKALTLGDTPSDNSLRKAFEQFGLDPRDPFDWRSLLDSFADAHFARVSGAPPKWDKDSWQLFEDRVALAREGLAKKPSGQLIAEWLHYKYYAQITPATIRQYLKSPPPAIRKLKTK
jgi:hypothetical protein